jgi:DNA-binding transcriptional regulator YiaG
MSIAKKLKAWRKARKLTQGAAANELGVSLRTLQEWEQARAEPRGYARSALEKVIAG